MPPHVHVDDIMEGGLPVAHASPPSRQGEVDQADLPEQKPRRTTPGAAGLYPFHLSNIHERCLSAYVARAVPLTIFVLTLAVSACGALFYPNLLLAASAFLNLWMWLWVVTYAVSTIRATRLTLDTVAKAEKRGGYGQLIDTADLGAAADVNHLIVLPNYKEDESILAATLEALSQAIGSEDFRVVLAMEEREGRQKAQAKALKLQECFGNHFTDLCAALHPLDLQETHLDGSVSAEVPGKSSNLKWAVNAGHERCLEAGLDLDSIVLTVADADCIFHPNYFDQVGHEFRELRMAANENAAGSRLPRTMWQAPQLPFRNYFSCLAPARIWGYVATVYEFGGVGGLVHAGFHMTFSSFSLPLALVIEASPWDGDVIADDHHCFLKCFLYSVYQKASEGDHIGGIDPPLVVRPVMLPVKSTSVVADGCLSSYRARFEQAKRHAQGVAELSYVLLAVFNLLNSLPRSAYSWALVRKLGRVVLLPLTINTLPIIQAFPFAAVSILWIANGGGLHQCPSSLWQQPYHPRLYMCAIAGGYNMGVPTVVAIGLVIFSSAYMLDACFVRPALAAPGLWHSEDGRLPPTLGSKRLTVLRMVAIDCIFLLPAIMPIYGMIPAVMAYWNCLVRGNRFDFISANKVAESELKRADSSPSPMTPRALQATIGRPEGNDAEVRTRQNSRMNL